MNPTLSVEEKAALVCFLAAQDLSSEPVLGRLLQRLQAHSVTSPPTPSLPPTPITVARIQPSRLMTPQTDLPVSLSPPAGVSSELTSPSSPSIFNFSPPSPPLPVPPFARAPLRPPQASMEGVFALSGANLKAVSAAKGKRTSKKKGKRALEVNSAPDGEGDNPGGGPHGINWDPECNRGARAFKETRYEFEMWNAELPDDEEIDHTILDVRWLEAANAALPHDRKAQLAIHQLAQSPETHLSHPRCRDWVENLRELFEGAQWVDGDIAFATNSLASLVQRCQRQFKVQGIMEFSGMMSLVQLVIKTDSLRKAHKISSTRVYKRLVADMPYAPTKRTFLSWISHGQKYCALAAAGSVYLLLIIAFRRACTMFARLNWKQIKAICYRLRTPDSTNIGLDIRTRILPLLKRVAQEVTLSMPSLFSSTLLETYDLPATINCSDLILSDQFFFAINNLDFKLINRDWDLWADIFCPHFSGVPSAKTIPLHRIQRRLLGPTSSTVTSLATSQATTPLHTRSVSPLSDNAEEEAPLPVDDPVPSLSFAESETLIQIKTAFNPAAQQNIRRPFPAAKGSIRDAWTEQQRRCAENAYVPTDIDDLRTALASLYDERGVKHPEKYIHITADLIAGLELLIECADESLQAYIVGNVPEELRANLHRNLEVALGGMPAEAVLQFVEEYGDKPNFAALHFSHYARSATKGHNAPSDVHPMLLQLSGKSRTNHGQMVPYLSKECTVNQQEYENLTMCLDEVLEWVEVKMESRLPALTASISAFAENLPGDQSSPAYPFSGYVINLNACTKAHRDGKDDKGCLVMAVGEFEHGDLILVESGLVIQLRSGDFTVFRSERETHLNLPYTGMRASIVCHTDREGRSWVKDRNGWALNSYLDDEQDWDSVN